MKVNLQQYLMGRNNIVEWSIIHMMTKADPNLAPWKGTDGKLNVDTKSLDVTLTINGVEVDFVEAIEEIQSQNKRMVEEQAKELLAERFGDVHGKMQELQQILDEAVEKASASIKQP